jgi:aldose 1-epimerase
MGSEYATNSGASVTRKAWGFAGSEEVFLFTLTNKQGLQMKVSNYGCAVQSLLVPDARGILTDIVLGYDTIDDYMSDPYYMGTIVGRFANRIASAEAPIDNQKVLLTKRAEGYHLHGGEKGFNKKVFAAETFFDEHEAGIRFFYQSPDGEEGFPGNLQLFVTYRLTNNNEWVIEYEAGTDKTTILNLTQHSYFNLSGHPEQTVLGHHLQINAHWYLPQTANQLPTGEFGPVDNTVFNFCTSIPVGLHLNKEEIFGSAGGYDHTWVLEKEHTAVLKPAATLYEASSGIAMDVLTTEPGLHLYTGNFLQAGCPGKKGQPFTNQAGLCLETQHFPNSPNEPGFPSTLLKAGEKFFSKTIYRFAH